MKQPLVNESLRIIRLYWGKTQAELARDLGVSQSYISEIEKAKREVTLDLLGKYSRALNVPMSSLLLFSEAVDGAPKLSRGKLFVADKVISLLKKLIPDDIDKAS
jgi:transcriptional regulator with XRE-family HTH domain